MDFLRRHIPWVLTFASVLLIVSAYGALIAPPTNFPKDSVVSIARGSSAPVVAEQLANAHIIRYASLLQLVLRVSGASANIHAGAYRFETSQNLFVIAYRLATGAYGFPPVRLTFIEGTTAREAATLVADAFPEISEADFLKEAKPYEGYLFPDTYLFSPSADAVSIVALMQENFNIKIEALLDDIRMSGHTLSDTVILASLVEKEARSTANRRIVAGILENRLQIGMPLQVDAVFGYIFNRDTYSPSFADLKVDSPYNTYTHTGLPPGPINNPGLDALDAVLHPTKTDYLYYLTGKDNLMHYATTYAGHQANRKKYLD